MKYRILMPKDSLEALILGKENDTEKSNFKKLLACLDPKFPISVNQEFGLSYPKIYRDEDLLWEGSYPSQNQLANLLEVDEVIFKKANLSSQLHCAASETRVGICCGVGGDVYVDPYEENN